MKICFNSPFLSEKNGYIFKIFEFYDENSRFWPSFSNSVKKTDFDPYFRILCKKTDFDCDFWKMMIFWREPTGDHPLGPEKTPARNPFFKSGPRRGVSSAREQKKNPPRNQKFEPLVRSTTPFGLFLLIFDPCYWFPTLPWFFELLSLCNYAKPQSDT